MPANFSPAEFAAFAALATTAVTVGVAALKLRAWVHDGAMEALRSEDGRRAIEGSVLGSAAIMTAVRIEAEHKAQNAVAPLSTKLDTLALDLRSMLREISDKLDKQSDRAAEIDKRLAIVESRRED